MKTLEKLKANKLADLNQVRGGKRVRSYNVSGEKIDVRKIDSGGHVVWVKYITP